MTRLRITGLLFVVTVAVMIFSQCQRDKPNSFKDTETYHDYVNFKRLSRVQQVEACGKCHQEIYRNEMAGPHANAYKNLVKHAAFVNSASFDCKPYCQYVNEVMPHCTNCHTGGNLFETVFKNVDEEKIIAKIASNEKKASDAYSAVARDGNSLITGVDCITCHYNGKNVVTTMDFVKAPGNADCPDFCSPEKSALFTSNINCYPCHQEQVISMVGYPTKAANCNSCHVEKNSSGKKTHYTYWGHNPEGKVIPRQMDIFSGLDITYSKSRQGISVVWSNTVLPHVRSVCTELVTVVEVTRDKKQVKSDTIRINCKASHDKQLSRWYKDMPVGGEPGVEFKHLNDSIVRFIKLPPSLQSGDIEVNITGYKKEQYWLSDSIRSVYVRKTIPLHL